MSIIYTTLCSLSNALTEQAVVRLDENSKHKHTHSSPDRRCNLSGLSQIISPTIERNSQVGAQNSAWLKDLEFHCLAPSQLQAIAKPHLRLYWNHCRWHAAVDLDLPLGQFVCFLVFVLKQWLNLKTMREQIWNLNPHSLPQDTAKRCWSAS